MSEIAPHLPIELLQQALVDARSTKDASNRASYLAGLAPHLPEILQEALETARSIKGFRDDYERATILAKLAPHLPEILEEALDAACSILNEPYSGSPLSELAPYLPPELLQQALDAARGIKDGSDRATCFSSLLLVLNLASIKSDFWREILRNLSHHERSALLEDIPKLSDAIIALGGTEALVATVRAIQEVCRQWP
ncbi:MAG: hypothetical protein HC769_24535 [Cyanobacteria bacterium CRU_2_1]|nr:hypothetical protein [Cyanobacteria bacterium CRU_2_1]